MRRLRSLSEQTERATVRQRGTMSVETSVVLEPLHDIADMKREAHHRSRGPYEKLYAKFVEAAETGLRNNEIMQLGFRSAHEAVRRLHAMGYDVQQQFRRVNGDICKTYVLR